MPSRESIRFGVLDSPNAPFVSLIERWHVVEALGFHNLWVGDHTADYRNPDTGPWFDGWVTLTAMAEHTSHVRVGSLVSNPILRHPVVLAKQAAAVDHLSAGRLELGLGTGIAAFDHAAMGSGVWPHEERTARFGEYVEIVDEVLRSKGRPVTITGRYYSTDAVRLIPDPAQDPRPPITIGGQSSAVLRVAAQRAECWNSDAHPAHDVDRIVQSTERQNALLDEYCADAGRDSTTLRRSVLLIHALDAWADADAFEQMVERFLPLGIREFVVFWPGDDRRPAIERAAAVIGRQGWGTRTD